MRRFALTMVFVLASTATALAAPFTVTAPLFSDNGLLPLSGSGAPPCGPGSSVSPALAWSNVPPNTKSFSIVVYDPDAGSSGGGYVHWVAYGIPATATSVPENFGAAATTGYLRGTNGSNDNTFRGYCPPPDSLHHFMFTVYATDLDPTALQPGLNREGLVAAQKGHILGAGSVVGRYSRP